MITSGTGVSHGDVCVVGVAGPGVSHDYVPCMVGVSHGDVVGQVQGHDMRHCLIIVVIHG